MVRRVSLLAILLVAAVLAYGGDVPGVRATVLGGNARAIGETTLRGGSGHAPAGTEAVSRWILTGSRENDNFGYSVAGAGDVNGDGYEDLIVGVPGSDADGTDAGRAYIYYGGRSVRATPDVVLKGAAAGDGFGWSVAGAGDVNGDGYDDVIVGAPFNDAGGANAGRAYIYRGGLVMDGTVDLTLTGAAAGDCFGYSVAGAGDVNGDGYGDVVVGAYLHDGGGTDAGGAFIYYGGAAMNAGVDLTLVGASPYDNFGFSVAGAGDVNGDGYGDVVVGAPFNDAGGTSAGRVYVYYGSAAMDGTADLTRTGEAAGDCLGWSVAGAGDVNSDGCSDVIEGAPYSDAGGADAGRAYICFGARGMISMLPVVLTGAAAGENFGVSAAGAGDVNGDGYEDVVVGAPLSLYGGRASICYGAASMDAVEEIPLYGEASDDEFAYCVSGVGDVNGDGYSDVFIGAYGNDAGGTGAGRAYLYSNSLTGPDIPDKVFSLHPGGSQLGHSIACAGDVNGDGYDDLIIGAPYNDGGGTDAGRAYIHFGGPVPDVSPLVVFTGGTAGERLGWGVAGAGDVNGDGYDDVIVGAPFNSAAGSSAGRAYIYFGGAAMDGSADVTLSGAAGGDYFGISVAGAGDVNGDGIADVIVGAEGSDAGIDNAGAAFIYCGGTAMDATADRTLTGAAADDRFGHSVAGAGNVNGDGYGDVIVGAWSNDAGGVGAGRAYIYYGSPAMDASADVILTGETANDECGWSVGGAGDLNGDGYCDVIVGAPYNSAGGTNSGRAYVCYGGPAMDGMADIVMTGVSDGDNFGVSVAGAGDVNGDGYDDLIVGANHGALTDSETGYAFLFFGGPAADAVVDITMVGESSGDVFGQALAGAGDVNGDGYDDVIVGAPLNDAEGASGGRAYLYCSSPPPVAPRITSVADVPFDQGGEVTVRWIRSAYDARGINGISSYLVERSRPPGASGFDWQPVANIIPRQRPVYECTVPTPNDSMAGNSGTYYFQVTARTSNLDNFWRSGIVSAHSVDNLSPAGVENLGVELIGAESVRLAWALNSHDPDIGGYVVYRSVASGFEPEESSLLASPGDTSFLDCSLPASPIVYYRVRARDIHGNLGAVSPQVAVALASTQSYAVDGAWNMISLPMNVDDFTTTAVYPTAISEALAYSGGYVSRSRLENGTGYWLKFPAEQNVTMAGFAVVCDTVPVVSGWNLVGSIGGEVASCEVESNPPGMVVSPFYGYASGYVASDTIEPHRGYWVKAQGGGELILTLSGAREGVVRIEDEGDRPPDPPFATGVAKEEVPSVFSLAQNFPNPFNPTTEIRYDVAAVSNVVLVVYDLLGREVGVLVNEKKAPGRYSARFDAEGLSSGVYFCRFTVGKYVETRKLLLVR